MELDLVKLQSLLTVKEVAELHEVATRVVRKEGKAGRIPGAIKVLGKLGFDPELVETWTPPEAGERVVGARREDGRQRYAIYATLEEKDTLAAQGFEISDPRAAAKARRAAKKAAAAESSEDDGQEVGEPVEAENPFQDFA